MARKATGTTGPGEQRRGRGRPPNRDERRRVIAEALQRVMARRGYDGASVALVAKEAGLTPGLVHYHFADKEEILHELLERLVSAHLERLERHLATVDADDPSQRIDAALEAHLATGRTSDPDALAAWVAITAEALRRPTVARRLSKALELLRARLQEIVVQGIKAGLFEPVDPEAAAAGLLATIQGYYVLAATARRLVPHHSALPTTTRMAQGLLGPKMAWRRLSSPARSGRRPRRPS